MHLTSYSNLLVDFQKAAFLSVLFTALSLTPRSVPEYTEVPDKYLLTLLNECKAMERYKML